MLYDLILAASEGAEGIPADHIAAKIAVPIAIVIFCGSVYMLLWSNYGAKKGALIYTTAFFGFTMMLGVFWWFGAPGTPTATGLQNFPGQPGETYQSQWYAFEPESERAGFFPATEDVTKDGSLDDAEALQPVIAHLGLQGVPQEELEDNDRFNFTRGDAQAGADVMLSLFLREQGEDGANLGGERRAEYIEAGEAGLAEQVDDPDAFDRDDPLFIAQIADEVVEIGRSDGTLLAGITAQALVNYVGPEGESVSVVVDEYPMFAFKQESNLWFPSAVWTFVSLLLFVLSLAGLDLLEQREKRALQEVEEPEHVAAPIRQ